jgi:sialidase-1
MKLSHDHGATWGETTVLPFAADPKFNTQHRAQTVYDQDTGAIFLFDDARSTKSSGGICAVQIWRTDDLGGSWTLVTNLTDSAKNTTGSGLATGIQLPSGKLVVCQRAGCNGNSAGDQGVHALWSVDHGATWQAGRRLSKGTNECQLARLSNGSLYINTRSGPPSPSNDRLVAVSNDEGVTWSAVRKEPALGFGPVCEGSLISIPALVVADGRHGGQKGGRTTSEQEVRSANALYYSHPAGATGRTHLTIRRSNDDAATWPDADARLIWAGPSAYSSLGMTADGLVAVLWEKDGGDLGFARIAGF